MKVIEKLIQWIKFRYYAWKIKWLVKLFIKTGTALHAHDGGNLISELVEVSTKDRRMGIVECQHGNSGYCLKCEAEATLQKPEVKDVGNRKGRKRRTRKTKV